jgi:hypothetical protein
MHPEQAQVSLLWVLVGAEYGVKREIIKKRVI